MPHVSIEFSEGIEQTHNIQLLCEEMFKVLSADEAFDDPAAIKIRAKPVKYFCIGTEPQTFAHATLLLMAGRDQLTRANLNKAILDVLNKALPDVGSLTVQEVEMTLETYAKRVLLSEEKKL